MYVSLTKVGKQGQARKSTRKMATKKVVAKRMTDMRNTSGTKLLSHFHVRFIALHIASVNAEESKIVTLPVVAVVSVVVAAVVRLLAVSVRLPRGRSQKQCGRYT